MTVAISINRRVHLNARNANALALAAGANTWEQLPSGSFLIPSQRDPNERYTTTPQMCTCQDAERHPERLCKHSIACNIVSVLLAAEEPAPVAAPRRPLTEAETAALFARL